tara:strand:+ start:130 stop:381 length:252 start_codon:yes stop_codon:yes gene_type:complete
MNKLLKMQSIAKMKLTTDAYLEHLNEQLDDVEDDTSDCPLNATALVKVIELTTNMTMLQSLEINQLREQVDELLEIHKSHFAI